MKPIDTIPVHSGITDRMNEFLRDALRRTSLPYLGWLFFGIVLALGAYFPWRSAGISALRPALFAYYTILTIHIVFRLKSGGRANALTPDMIFLFFYTMFHLGYMTIYGLGLIPFFEGIFIYENSIPQAMLVVNLGLVGFLFGYELFGTKNPQSAVSQPIKIPTQHWCTLGLVLMIIAAAMHIIPLIIIGGTELAALGYQAVAAARGFFPSALAMFLTQSNHLLFFGVMIYMISSALRYQKLFQSKIALGIFIGMIAIFILEGDRGPVVQLMLPFMMVRHYFIKRIRLRYLLVVFFIFSTVFAGLALVRRLAFNPSMMWQSYKYARGEGIVDWRNLFIEAGGSIRCTFITCDNVPTHEPYWYGKSYLSAGLHIFPFLEGYCINQGWLGIWASWPSRWVSYSFEHGLGAIGYTIATEGYLNFGFPGVFLLLMFLGGLMRVGMIWFAKRPSAALAFVMICWIIYPLLAVRNHIQQITGYAFFQVPIIAVFAYLLCKYEPQLEDEYLYTDQEEISAFSEYTECDPDQGPYAPQVS
jgi:oligosaccharide repeat unit polymerase